MWREPVHCSLFFQYRHNTCTIPWPNHTHRTHDSFYAGTLIGARYQCAIRKLYRSSRSTSHRSSIEWRPLLASNQHIPDSLTRFKISSESLNGISGWIAFGTYHSCLNGRINVCLSRLSLKFLRDDSVNVGHYCNTAADFCSSVRLLHSSVGVGLPRSSDTADYSRNEMGICGRG